MKRSVVVFSCAFALASVTPAQAASVNWIGATDSNFSEGTNWEGDAAPGAGDTAVIDSANVVEEGFNDIVVDLVETEDEVPVPIPLELHNLTFEEGTYNVSGESITLRPLKEGIGDEEVISTTVLNVNGSSTVTIDNDINVVPLEIDRVLSTETVDNASFALGSSSTTFNGDVNADGVDLFISGSSPVATFNGTLTSRNLEFGAGTVANLNGTVSTGLIRHNGSYSYNDGIVVGGQVTASEVRLTYSDLTVAGDGSLDLSGGDIYATNGSWIVLDNSETASNERIDDASRILLEINSSGGGIEVIGNATEAVAENLGDVLVEGAIEIKVNADGQATWINLNSLTSFYRNADNVYNYSNTLPSVNYVTDGEFGGLERVYITQTPVLDAYGLMKNATINSLEFATYDNTVGVKSATTSTDLSTAGSDDHVFATGTQAKAAGTQSVASLVLNGGDINGTGELVVRSGRVRTLGDNVIQSRLTFNEASGSIGNTGILNLQNGVKAANGANVLISGGQVLLGASDVAGATVSVSSTSQFTFLENYAVSGASFNAQSSNIDMNGTSQDVAYWNSSGSIIGGGGVVSYGNVYVQSDGTVDTNFLGEDVVVAGRGHFVGGISASKALTLRGFNGALRIDGNISEAQFNGDFDLDADLLVSGNVHVSDRMTLGGRATVFGGAGTTLTLSGQGSVRDLTRVDVQSGAKIRLVYDLLNHSLQDRFDNNDLITLDDQSGLIFENTFTADTQRYEDAGVLEIRNAGGSSASTIDVLGNMSVSFNSFNFVGDATELLLDIDAASGAQLRISRPDPDKLTGTDILSNVWIKKYVGDEGEYLRWFAEHDSSLYTVREAVATELAELGGFNDASEFVEINDATTEGTPGTATVGALVFNGAAGLDAANSRLTVETGQAFFLQDSDITLDRLTLNNEAQISSAVSTNFTGDIYASELVKSGSGVLNLDGRINATLFEIWGGDVNLDNGAQINATVKNYGDLNLDNGSRINGNVTRGTVRLTGNSSISGNASTVVITDQVGGVSGNVSGTLSLKNASFDVVAGRSVGTADIDASSVFTNAGSVGTVRNQNFVTNDASIGRFYNEAQASSLDEGSRAINNGSVAYLHNGQFGSSRNADALFVNTETGSITKSINNASDSIVTTRGAVTLLATDGVDSQGNPYELTSSNDGTINIQGGTFTVEVGAKLIGDGVINQSWGTFTINGTVSNDIVLNDGLINGSGFIVGDLVHNGGAIRPGNSPGNLVIQGDYTIAADAILSLEYGTDASDLFIVEGLFTAEEGAIIDINLMGDLTTDDLLAEEFSFANFFGGIDEAELDAVFSVVTFTATTVGDGQQSIQFDETGAISGFAPVVPIPATVWLFGSGLVGLAGLRRRRKAAA